MDTYLQFKIAILGDSGVGKSSILSKYVHNIFDEYSTSTIGAAYLTKNIPLPNNRTVKLQFWDTAGQERYRSLAPMYYRGAGAIIVVYDIFSENSFINAKRWVSEVRRTENLIIVIVGNKLDKNQKRNVDLNEVLSYVKSENFIHAEVSAKTGEGIENLFKLITEKIPESFTSPTSPKSQSLNLKESTQKSWWKMCF